MTNEDLLKILADVRRVTDKFNLRVVAASKKKTPLTEDRERIIEGVVFQLAQTLTRIKHASECFGARKNTPEYDYRREILQATHTAFAKNQITFDEYTDVCKALNELIV